MQKIRTQEDFNHAMNSFLGLANYVRSPEIDYFGEEDCKKLKQETAHKAMELIGNIVDKHRETHLQCAEWLQELKELMEGTGLWTKLVDKGIGPYSRDAVYDLLKARQAMLQWKQQLSENPEDTAVWDGLMRGSTRTMRILSCAEQQQFNEVVELAKAGEEITEKLARSVVKGTAPATKKLRQLRAAARDKTSKEWIKERSEMGVFGWMSHFHMQLIDLTFKFDELEDQKAVHVHRGLFDGDDPEDKVEPCSLGLGKQICRHISNEGLLELREFIDTQLAANRQAAVDDDVITVEQL